MTAAEARWRAERMQHLLDGGMERYEALAQVLQEARSIPWIATESIASSAHHTSAIGEFQG